ncbi:MAG: UPF0175 family protein [Pirellulaceae bacterium]
MSLMIPDAVLEQAGLSEEEGKLEIACRLFAAGKLSKSSATHWLGLSRTEFEDELLKRDLPLTVYTAKHLEQDLKAVRARAF